MDDGFLPSPSLSPERFSREWFGTLWVDFRYWLAASWVNKFAVFSLFCIVVSGAILFLAMVGAIKYPDKDTKDLWIEVNSQILNGFFTIAALYNHPMRLFLLYCYFFDWPRCFARFPYASWEVALLLFFLNLNCFAQYVMDAAMFGFYYKKRPFAMVVVSLLVSFSAAIIAGIYEHFLSRREKRRRDEDHTNEIEVPLH